MGTTQAIRTGVRLMGEVVDVHARLETATASGVPAIRWCGVYVLPKSSEGPTREPSRTLVPGYWYTLEGDDAWHALMAAGVLS